MRACTHAWRIPPNGPISCIRQASWMQGPHCVHQRCVWSHSMKHFSSKTGVWTPQRWFLVSLCNTVLPRLLLLELRAQL